MGDKFLEISEAVKKKLAEIGSLQDLQDLSLMLMVRHLQHG